MAPCAAVSYDGSNLLKTEGNKIVSVCDCLSSHRRAARTSSLLR